MPSAFDGVQVATQSVDDVAVFIQQYSGSASDIIQVLTSSADTLFSVDANGQVILNTALDIYSAAGVLTHVTIGVDANGPTFTPPSLAGTLILDLSALASSISWASQATGGTVAYLGDTYKLPYVAKTANYTATTSDFCINCTSGTFTVTLPTAVGVAGRMYRVKNSGTGAITVGTTSSQTIDGSTTQVLSVQYTSIDVMSDGTNWIIT